MAQPASGTRAWCGVAAAAVALGVTGLLAAAVGPESDARTAVGSAVIDLAPAPVKEWAIATFGMSDKLVLSVLVLAVIAGIAAIAGSFETRRLPVGSAAIVIAGIAGSVAVLSRAGATAIDVIPTVVGTLCGVAVLRFLTSGRFTDAADTGDGVDRGRRLSLLTLGFLAAGALSGTAGAVLSRLAASVAGDRAAYRLPPVDVAAAP